MTEIDAEEFALATIASSYTGVGVSAERARIMAIDALRGVNDFAAKLGRIDQNERQRFVHRMLGLWSVPDPAASILAENICTS